MKSEVLNPASIGNAIREQWRRLREGFESDEHRIQSMHAMYVVELRELHSATIQFCALADEMWITIRNNTLAERLGAYAADVRSRVTEIQGMLDEVDHRGHDRMDPAMQALVMKASRTAERCGDRVRDAGLAGALQAMMHYMIAEHGTLAAHARVVGREADAARFAGYAEHDKAMDAEISDMAVCSLNVETIEQKN